MTVPRYQTQESKIGRPLKFPTPEALQEAIDNYFRECRDRKIKTVTKSGEVVEINKPMPLTMAGLAVALGISRQTLVNYSYKDDFLDTVKRARETVEADMESRMLDGASNPIGSIFSLKNNFGWADKQEIETTSRITLSVPDDVEDTGDKAE